MIHLPICCKDNLKRAGLRRFICSFSNQRADVRILSGLNELTVPLERELNICCDCKSGPTSLGVYFCFYSHCSAPMFPFHLAGNE